MTEIPQANGWSPATYYEAGNPNPLGSLGEPQVHEAMSSVPEIVTEVPAEILHATGEMALEGAGLPHTEVQEVESAREKRNRELFAPLPYFQKPVAEQAVEPQSYDYLFADEATFFSQPPKVDRFGNKERQWLPTEQTRKAASERLITAAKRDEELVELIQRQAKEIDLSDPMKVVDALRLKPDFRLVVGNHLLEKMDAFAAMPGVMPDRIARNTDKSADKGGYPIRTMTSREYATLLALSMIDGTFDEGQVAGSDKIERHYGEVRQGQHRAAAREILGLPD